jgi:hypothetical protein
MAQKIRDTIAAPKGTSSRSSLAIKVGTVVIQDNQQLVSRSQGAGQSLDHYEQVRLYIADISFPQHGYSPPVANECHLLQLRYRH